MAVYTHVSLDDLNRFLRAYDIGIPLEFSAIAEGIENSNYRLETDQSRFILTLYEKRVQEADLPFFLSLMSHLHERGLPCPKPVAGRDAIVLRRLNGRPAAIVSFLPGRWSARPGVEQTGAAGAMLARMHEAAQDFGGTRPNNLGVRGWRKLFDRCAMQTDEVCLRLAPMIEEELTFLKRSWPQDLPRGVIHADLFPDNVLYTDDRVSGIIDFYFAAEDFLAFDIAICLNAWCFDDACRFRPAHARALLEGYESVRPLLPAERAGLRVLARGSAMRFLLTRLYDRLHPEPEALVTPKDPLRYVRRLQFHQQNDLRRALA